MDDDDSGKTQWLTLALGLGAAAAAAVALRGRGSTHALKDAAPALAESAAAASERVYREFQALGREYNMAAMSQTVAQAVNRHQRWTTEELAVLRDPAKTALEKALELGRTYNGVMSKAIRMGASSKAP
ncbi:hypothetical protein [Nocardioides sp.]|uniref:hypothetical protein n=1 Tax=Nocardioides sp. TaxID=35761 RepID=UPI002ED79062